MYITMMGAGNVSLASGARFADFGHRVTGANKDGGKIAALQRRDIAIFERGLDALVAANAVASNPEFLPEDSAIHDLKHPDRIVIALPRNSPAGAGCYHLLRRCLCLRRWGRSDDLHHRMGSVPCFGFPRLKQVMQQPIMIDPRNVYRPEEMAKAGFAYEGLGRRVKQPPAKKRDGNSGSPSQFYSRRLNIISKPAV